MTSNPFIVSGKIPAEYFCDREAETAELHRLITNHNNVVLVSQRRMGKTGLISRFYDEESIKNNYYTFFIDILSTTTLREFIFMLGKEIFRVLSSKSQQLATGLIQALKSLTGKFTFDHISGMPLFNIQLGDIKQPEITLEEIFKYLSEANKPCVVAIDEFQQIAEYPEKNIEAILRSYIQRSSNCQFIFSGSETHMLREMFMETARPFYNSAAIMELREIPRKIYLEFIQHMFVKKGKMISFETAQRIYDLFEGHTFYIQRTCNEAFSYTPADGICNHVILDEALDNIISSYSVLYEDSLSRMTLKQKEILYAIASEGTADNILSENFIESHALSSASSVQSAARQLEKRGVIVRSVRGWRVNDRFLGIWLQRLLA